MDLININNIIVIILVLYSSIFVNYVKCSSLNIYSKFLLISLIGITLHYNIEIGVLLIVSYISTLHRITLNKIKNETFKNKIKTKTKTSSSSSYVNKTLDKKDNSIKKSRYTLSKHSCKVCKK